MTQTASPVARLWNLLREERADITAIYFFAILGGLIQLSLPIGIQAIIGFVLGGTLSASLVVLISVVVAGVGFTGVTQINQMKVIERIQQRLFTRYAFAFADRIPKLDVKAIDGYYLPELVNRFFDTTALQKGIAKLLLDLPTAMIQILFGLILLSFYHPFFILFGVLLLVLVWLMLYLTGSRGLQSSLDESRYKYGLAGWLQEMARLIKSFKFSSSAGLHLQKANQENIGYLGARTKHFSVLLLQYRTLVLFKVAITGALLIVGVSLLLNQQLNIGQFVAAEIIIITVISAVEKIIVNLDSVYDVLTAVEKVSKLTDKPVEASGSHVLSDAEPLQIEATHLSFGYDTNSNVLSNVSFAVPAGSVTCITGNDGSGKSTLLKLLAGVYRNFSGSLLINSVPISNYHLASLRQQTGILLQHETLFNGSLWENIAMGRSDIDRGYIMYLFEQTGLQTFFAALPNGFDTELQSGNGRLSQSVIRKLLLVRALAPKPKLLLLEEPWLGIEEPHRQTIQQLLLSLTNTTVVVATNDEAFARRCYHAISLTPNH